MITRNILIRHEARDIQGLEMNPLGPLHGKSFLTSLSPWIITLEALSPFKTSSPQKNPEIKLPAYFQDSDPKPTFNFTLEATIQPAGVMTAFTICKTTFSSIYWTIRDLVVQQTINGCNLRTGDLLATGTISGSTPESHGCLMEVAAKGGVGLGVNGVSGNRIFLEDGDTVTITAKAGEGVGFGDCTGTIKGSI
jgi:fumarylacetoacetase